jgi:NodT family efflux transporter outer membrane factor (OMF) lipoprotein
MPVALATLVAGCAVGPNFERPSPWSPASWFGRRTPKPDYASLPTNQPVDPEWWNNFHDPVLTGLMRRVGESNLDVRTTVFRLAESRAQRGISAADQYAQVNANGSYSRERLSQRGVVGILGGSSSSSNGSGTSVTNSSNGLGGTQGGVPVGGSSGSSGGGTPAIPAFNLFQAGFDASYELDLWGRVRRAIESADAAIDASTEARRQTLVTALAELARDYVQLRGTQDQIRIARANLGSAQESANLSNERFRGGLATDLDVANARAQVEATAAAIPQFEQQQDQLVNAISLLLGAPPGALASELLPPKPVPPVPPRVPVGIPSDLLQRRPDIRQSEAQLHAATADIGQAKADFFPRVTLSGSFALQALQIKDLGNFGSRTYGFGPNISIPIFEGGRLRRTLELREAQQQEAAINYQRTVLTAFHDVDNALIAYRAEQNRRDRLAAQAGQARRALGLAQQRFREGLSDFLEVLTAQRTVLQAEQQLADSTTTVSTNLVQLYKALGGGWETTDAQAARR